MATIIQPLSAAERAMRSVFVGNIPYEATEEQLRDIFTQAGPVVSFRIVYDRETGKPKGYGFCEYQDIETSQSAMRNLNNTDFNGRPLRVGAAAGEQNKDDTKSMQQATGGAIIESPFGDPVEPKEAPEAISKAVASLPPEQMYELMKQMKLCIQNNPTEARNMLLQNPQLAYALLQAQIVMKIVDPQVAIAMLQRERDQIPPIMPSEEKEPPPVVSKGPAMSTSMPPMSMGQGNMGQRVPPLMGSGPSQMQMAGMMGDQRPPMGMNNQMGGPPQQPVPSNMNMGFQAQPGMNPMAPMQGFRPGGPMSQRPGMPTGNMNRPQMGGPPMGGPGPQGFRNQIPTSIPQGMQQGTPISSQDQEKAALIMQVLQLSDEQIAMLPSDQRQSILVLKEQIAKSAPS
ncbi:cleavage stimulation factor subunit 2-like [Lineus longissimus]|uniref:cleavage stimulation factor subunit 2-like n=1 Tax=Lineus longissimus TaxID=88925 RepID=UPI002B4F05DA